MTLRRRSRYRTRTTKGFAALLAISLMVLVASILTALGAMSVADAKRTRNQHSEAQLRQLLTAGAIAADRTLESNPSPRQDQVIALPTELRANGAALRLSFTANGADRMNVRVHVELGDRRTDQWLDFSRETQAPPSWKLMAARLVPPTDVKSVR